MYSPRVGSNGLDRMHILQTYICIVVKMQNKEFEKQCFQYTLLTFVFSIQILILLTVSDSRIYPDTIHIEQGYSIHEYLTY